MMSLRAACQIKKAAGSREPAAGHSHDRMNNRRRSERRDRIDRLLVTVGRPGSHRHTCFFRTGERVGIAAGSWGLQGHSPAL